MGKNKLTYTKEYAARGWHVLPLNASIENGCSCGKEKCSSTGKHPLISNGVKGATTDINTIKKWWVDWYYANIGIATGKESGIVVLDIDPKNGGFESFKGLIKQHGELPKTVKVITGSGGYHFYFKYPAIEVKNRTNIIAGIDFRGDGGYVVAPPSNHASGNLYKWDDGCSPGDIKLAEMPDWLLDLVVNKNTKKEEKIKQIKEATAKKDSDLFDDLDKQLDVILKNHIIEGSRNNTLTSIAGKLNCKGFNEAEIIEKLLEINESRCKPPLDEQEVITTAKSIAKYENILSFPLTDIGNARRLVYYYGENIRYCIEKKCWLVWDETRWTFDIGDIKIMSLAKKAVMKMYDEVKKYG